MNLSMDGVVVVGMRVVNHVHHQPCQSAITFKAECLAIPHVRPRADVLLVSVVTRKVAEFVNFWTSDTTYRKVRSRLERISMQRVSFSQHIDCIDMRWLEQHLPSRFLGLLPISSMAYYKHNQTTGYR